MDWSRNVYFECLDSNPSLEACGVPFSCCILLQNQVRSEGGAVTSEICSLEVISSNR